MRYDFIVKNRQFPALWIMVAIILPLIGILAWNQFAWLQEMQAREERQIETRMHSSVQSLSRALMDELMFFPALLRIKHEPSQDMKTVFSERFQFWSLYALNPELIRNIYLINNETKESLLWSRSGFIRAEDPAHLALTPDEQNDDSPIHWSRTPEGGVILFFSFWQRDGESYRVSFSVAPDVVEDSVIPKLAAIILEEKGRYAYRICNKDTGRILYETPEGLDDSIFRKTVLDVPLSDPIPVNTQNQHHSLMKRRLSELSPGPTSLHNHKMLESIRPHMDVFPAIFTSIRIQAAYYKDSPYLVSRKTTMQNSAISFGILVLLVFVIVILAEATRRSSALALSQQNFIASVTHELKTPLAVISSASQNLSDGIIRDPGKSTQYGAVINKEALRLTAAIDHFLLYANTRRLSPSMFSDLNLAEIITSALSFTHEERTMSCFVTELHIPEDAIIVQGDRLALLSVMKNLIQNVVRHARSGMYLGITLEQTKRKGRQLAVISIRDKGPGIPSNEQKRIFEPFERGKRAVEDQIPGNGVGLNLARRIVSIHHGSIALESKPGSGCVFTIVLPESQPAIRQAGDGVEHSRSCR